MTLNRAQRGVVVGLVLSAAGAARGQCPPSWQPGSGIPGINGLVFDVVSWDPDGAGPLPPVLVIGGNYSLAGGMSAEDVAAWDGSAWSEVGGGVGLNVAEEVAALEVYGGELIACGGIHVAGGTAVNHIARFDGASWKPLGLGANNYVAALGTYRGELIAGGFFDHAGGAPASRIARWNGSAWAPLGAGVFGGVTAVTEYQGELIAAGMFSNAGGAPANRIARWNGSAWQPLGLGLGMTGLTTVTLRVYSGELYAAGAFGSAGLVPATNIARWNGSAWSAVGAGSLEGVNGGVAALTTHNGELIVGGGFSAVAGGTVSAASVARWDGVTWNSVGPVPGTGGFLPSVLALCSHDGGLIAGGGFPQIGGTPVNGIARLDGPLAGGAWSSLGGGFNDGIEALGRFGGALIAGGFFSSFNGVIVNHVARREGAAWQALGNGLDGEVFALREHEGSLFAGGVFAGSGSVSAPGIARWDGAEWSGVGGAGAGANGAVYALRDYRGDLVAGGEFSAIGGVPVNQIARWDGAAWHTLGSGVGAGHSQTTVSALGEYQGSLYVGGDFTIAGGVPASSVARWDGGAWQALGSGVAGEPFPWVHAFAEYHGVLYVGGEFFTAGGLNSPNLARWNGVAWGPVGAGTPLGIAALEVLGEDLVVGGSLLGLPSTSIARWNDAGAGSWLAMGDGLSGVPRALLAHGGGLSVGGSFTRSGPIVTAFYARWECSCYPDCSGDGSLTIADFGCFQTKFVAGDPYADCNSVGGLTVADFGCFQTRFVAGCP